MIALMSFAALAPAAAQEAAPAVWSLEAPKGAPAILTYAEGGVPLVQMTCQPASGQVAFRVSVQKRLASRKSGLIWTNALGMPAPWPASVTLTSGVVSSTLRGSVDADPSTGASWAVVEASTQAPVFKGFAKTGVLTFTVLSETVWPNAAKPSEARKFLGVCR